MTEPVMSLIYHRGGAGGAGFGLLLTSGFKHTAPFMFYLFFISIILHIAHLRLFVSSAFFFFLPLYSIQGMVFTFTGSFTVCLLLRGESEDTSAWTHRV